MHIAEFLDYWTKTRIDALIDSTWSSATNAANAKTVCDGESSYRPLVFNMYYSQLTKRWHRVYGLFQISDIHVGDSRLPSVPSWGNISLLFEPEVNVAVAKELWVANGRKWCPTWSAACLAGIA